MTLGYSLCIGKKGSGRDSVFLIDLDVTKTRLVRRYRLISIVGLSGHNPLIQNDQNVIFLKVFTGYNLSNPCLRTISPLHKQLYSNLSIAFGRRLLLLVGANNRRTTLIQFESSRFTAIEKMVDYRPNRLD